MVWRALGRSYVGQGLAQRSGDKGKRGLMGALFNGDPGFGQLSVDGLGHDDRARRVEVIGFVAAGERLAHKEIDCFLTTVGGRLGSIWRRGWLPDAPIDHAIGQRDLDREVESAKMGD